MGTIKDEAVNYKPKGVKNISELPEIETTLVLFKEENVEYPYTYLEMNGERYKMPDAVLASLQAIIKSNPNLKKFKVTKQGQGMNTKYVVIPLA